MNHLYLQTQIKTQTKIQTQTKTQTQTQDFTHIQPYKPNVPSATAPLLIVMMVPAICSGVVAA